MSSLKSKTCCQSPGGGESPQSSRSTNTAGKQKVQRVWREIAGEVAGEIQEGEGEKEREGEEKGMWAVYWYRKSH